MRNLYSELIYGYRKHNEKKTLRKIRTIIDEPRTKHAFGYDKHATTPDEIKQVIEHDLFMLITKAYADGVTAGKKMIEAKGRDEIESINYIINVLEKHKDKIKIDKTNELLSITDEKQ